MIQSFSRTKKYLINWFEIKTSNYNGLERNITHVKMKYPTQVPPQMKSTLTPKLAALIAFEPVVLGLTRYGVK